MPKCTTRGCRQLATWEIEIRRAGAEYGIYYACDEHCPDPVILSPQVSQTHPSNAIVSSISFTPLPS